MKIHLTVFLLLLVSKCLSQEIIQLHKKNGVYWLDCALNNEKLNFVFDTGASGVNINLDNARTLYKKGLIKASDFVGIMALKDATGEISVGYKFNIKSLQIGNLILTNLVGLVVPNDKAPLLLGNEVLSKLGKISIDYNRNTITIDNEILKEKSKTINCLKEYIYQESNYADELEGIKLFQFDSCVLNSLGMPNEIRVHDDDTLNVDLKYHLTNPERMLSVGLSAFPETKDMFKIVNLEITGMSSDFNYRGISLGKKFTELLNKEDFEFMFTDTSVQYPVLVYSLKNSNVIISCANNTIVRIQIHMEELTEFARINDNLLNGNNIMKAIKFFSPEDIKKLFSPDFEIYTESYGYIYFINKYSDELKQNEKFSKFVSDKNKGLKTLIDGKTIIEPVKLRFTSKSGIMFVFKLKNNQYIDEIVLRPYLDKLMIYEINGN